MSKDNRSNSDTKKMALSARSKWLEGYSMLLSNGFVREHIWMKDGKTFKTNKDAIKYMESLMERD